MPGIVDPRPAQEAYLRSLKAELEAATDDAERQRIQGEIHELETQMGRQGGFLRRLLLGFGHRSTPW